MKILKPYKLRALDNRGLSHLLVPLLVIVTLAVGGTFMVVASHANGGDVLGTNTGGASADGAGSGSGKKTAKKPKKSKIDPNTTKLYVYNGAGTLGSFQIVQGGDSGKVTAAKCGVSPLAGSDHRISKTPTMNKSKFNLSEKEVVQNGVKRYPVTRIICKDPASGHLMIRYAGKGIKKNKAKFNAKPILIGEKDKSCYFVHFDGINKSHKSYNFVNGKCEEATPQAGAASAGTSGGDEGGGEADNPVPQDQLQYLL